MYLRAGMFSFGLLLLSRVLGLLRESAQAAAFGSTGMGDVVIVMFTLPDLLVGILVSGALSYVLLPVWAKQSTGTRAAGQKKMACALTFCGLVLGALVWLFRDALGQALAPGLAGEMKVASANALGWSAAVLPLAMLAALWATRLQHECDFVGMYAGNLIVNASLVGGLLLAANSVAPQLPVVSLLGACLIIAMLGRLVWLGWRLPRRDHTSVLVQNADMPSASVWVWAALSSGLLLVFPLAARSLASGAGEGALASFNYAWKMIELPLILAVQLVASLAFPAITRTQAGSAARQQAVGLASLIAWALACAAAAVVATFSLPIAKVLFGWGRMSPGSLELIAQWSAIGIWSLLPQALIAVLLTVFATEGRMRGAVWILACGLVVLLAVGFLGISKNFHSGVSVMWLLNGVFAGMAVAMLMLERQHSKAGFSFVDCLPPLLVCVLLVALKPFVADFGTFSSLLCCAAYTLLVVGSTLLANPILRSLVMQKLKPLTPQVRR